MVVTVARDVEPEAYAVAMAATAAQTVAAYLGTERTRCTPSSPKRI